MPLWQNVAALLSCLVALATLLTIAFKGGKVVAIVDQIRADVGKLTHQMEPLADVPRRLAHAENELAFMNDRTEPWDVHADGHITPNVRHR